MKYLVAGRIYSDYNAARFYADLLHRIGGLIVAVEAIEHPTPEFQSLWDKTHHTLKHPPASP